MSNGTNSGESHTSLERILVMGLERRFGYLGYSRNDIVTGIVDAEAEHAAGAYVQVRRCAEAMLLWSVSVHGGYPDHTYAYTYGYSTDTAHELLDGKLPPDAPALTRECSYNIIYTLAHTDWDTQQTVSLPEAA